jgi:2'-5' RNA ligase
MDKQAKGIRSFVALPSSQALRSALHAVQSELKEAQADVKWDSPDKFHITLKFLGNVPPETLSALSDSLARAVPAFESFSLTYDRIGAFPDLVHPRVLWVGAQSSEALVLLQMEVERVCEQFKFAREPRDFHPHITLGRVKGSGNLARLTARAKSITFESVTTDCSEVLLIQSDLRATGSVYTTLKSFPLKA